MLPTNRTNAPPFHKVNPWVYNASWVFAFLNIFFLAPGFVIGSGAKGLPLVGSIPQIIWGFVFVLLGISFVYGLVFNSWKLIKYTHVGGLFTKSLFAWGLVFTLPTNYKNPGVIGIWVALIAIQAICIAYFAPEIKNGINNG